MRAFGIYKITSNTGEIKLYKQLKEFYNDYQLHTLDVRNYDNFRYTINNDLYNTDKTYIFKGIKYNYKMDIGTIEKFNFKDFLQEYLNEYNIIREVNNTDYANSSKFYNKIFKLAKYRVEKPCNLLPTVSSENTVS